MAHFTFKSNHPKFQSFLVLPANSQDDGYIGTIRTNDFDELEFEAVPGERFTASEMIEIAQFMEELSANGNL